MADLFRDFVYTRNTVPVTDTDTSIQVEDVSLFPSNNVLAKGEFFLAFDSTLTYPHSFEIVRLVSVNVGTKTLTVVRGQAGTVAVGHAIVTYIKGTLNADQVERARAGFSGTLAPAPDSDVFLPGDRFYHTTEGRFYAFTGNAGFLRDTFTRAASTTTMGSTELQTLVGEIHGILAPQYSQVVPYTAPWVPNGTNIFGINASNQAYLVTGTAGAASLVNVGSTDFDVTFDTFMTSTAGSDYGIFFRVDAEQKYGYYLQFAGTTASLFRLVNGTFGAISGVTTTYTAGAIRNWRVWVEGNRIRVFRDGTQAIDYTETTTGFITGSATYRPGAHVGLRYGNATAVSDTTIVWDNFTCTAPNNVGLNNPRPQGWAPVSSLLGPLDTSSYSLKQVQRLQNDLVATANTADDLIEVAKGLESAVGRQGLDLTVFAQNYDELLETFKAQPNYDPLFGNLATTANTVDDIIDVLSTLIRTGVGSPGGTPRDAEVYVDLTTRTIWTGTNGSWVPVTYSGPNAQVPALTYIGATSTNSSTGTFPAGTQVGDLAISLHNTANTSDGNIFAPSGWTRMAASNPVSQYYNSYSFAYKTVTQADLTAGTFAFSSGTSGNTQTATRVYRNAAFVRFTSSQNAGGNPTTVTGPTIATTAGQTVLNWFSSANNNHNPNFEAPLQNNVVRTQQGFAWQMAQDEVATGTTSTARQVRWTTGDNASAWAFFVVVLNQIGDITFAPAARMAAGVPTGTAPTGSLYIDTTGNANAAYVYNGTEWVGANTQRVVLTTGDYTAKGGDYVVANTTNSGRSSVVPTHDSDNEIASTASPQNVTLTTTLTDCLIVAIRATWSSSGFSGTLNGAAMTRRNTVRNFNGGSHSELFTGDTLVQPGTQTIALSGGTSSGIGWSSAMAIKGVKTDGAVYAGVTNAQNITFTLPATGPGFVVLYTQRNSSPRPSLTSGGILTFTDRGGFVHGSENSSSWYTAPYSQAQAGQSVTVTISPNDTTWGHTNVAMFPASGDPTVFDPSNFAVITLPAPTRGSSVIVHSNDQAGNEIRIATTSGLINGTTADALGTRYLGAIYTADGTNWLKLATGGGGGGSAATVVSKSAAYTARHNEIVLANAGTAPFSVTLPSSINGNTVTVKKTDGSGNAVTVVPQSGLVDNAANLPLLQQYDSYTLVCDGTNWWLV